MQKRIENYSPKSNNHLTVIYQKPTSPPNGKIHFYGQKYISTVFEIIEKKSHFPFSNIVLKRVCSSKIDRVP